MNALLLVIVCLALGLVVARTVKPPSTLSESLNWWVLNVALPALVLHLVPGIELGWSLWFPIAAIWFVFLGGWALFTMLGRVWHWPRQRVGALTLVCGLGNTAFVGYALIEALRGGEALELAVIADQAGFVAFAVGGTIVAAIYSGADVSAAQIARKVLFFPAFVALFIGVVVGLAGGWPSAIDALFARLGETLAPIALFSVGLQFQLHVSKGALGAVAAALSWKLLFAPAIVFLAGYALHIPQPIFTITLLQAAMAPMITPAILAIQHDLEPRLVSTILGLGIVLSLLSVPLLSLILP